MSSFRLLLLAGCVSMPAALLAQAPPTPAATGLIVGTAMDGATGRPVGNAVVSLSRVRQPDEPDTTEPFEGEVLTGADGRFLFGRLAAGTYRLSGSRVGYVDARFGDADGTGFTPLVIGTAEIRTDVALAFTPAASISGLVLDERGDPVVGVNVTAASRVLSRGRPQWNAGRNTMTDDRGQFRLGQLTPGEYFVLIEMSNTTVPTAFLDKYLASTASATSSYSGNNPWMSELQAAGGRLSNTGTSRELSGGLTQSVNGPLSPFADARGRQFVFATTYYPSSVTAEAATPIALGPGEARADLTFTLRAAPAVQVSGALTGPNGPIAMTAVTLSIDGAMPSPGFLGTGFGAVTDAGGRFTFSAVPAGTYRLRATAVPHVEVKPNIVRNMTTNADGTVSVTMRMDGAPEVPPLPPDPTLWADTTITVGDEDISNLLITPATGARLSGRLVFRGSATPPGADAMKRVNVSIVPVAGARNFRAPRVRMDETGQITTQGFPAGDYEINVYGLPKPWTVSRITADGADVLDQALRVERADVTSLTITATDRAPGLTGTVQAASGGAPRAALVVLFPADRPLDVDGILSRRVQTARTKSDGSFRFEALVPGDYRVAAVDDVARAASLTAEWLRSLAASATRVTLSEGGSPSVALKLEVRR